MKVISELWQLACASLEYSVAHVARRADCGIGEAGALALSEALISATALKWLYFGGARCGAWHPAHV